MAKLLNFKHFYDYCTYLVGKIAGWWQLKDFLYFHPKPWGDDQV